MRRSRTILALAAVITAIGTAGAGADVPCLFTVNINPESRVTVERGNVPARLQQGVWQSFRLCFNNEAKITAVPRVASQNAPLGKDRNHWLEIRMEPAVKRLSGGREYRTLRLRSRDAGQREATFSFDVGQGTEDLAFRAQVSVLFQCLPATPSAPSNKLR